MGFAVYDFLYTAWYYGLVMVCVFVCVDLIDECGMMRLPKPKHKPKLLEADWTELKGSPQITKLRRDLRDDKISLIDFLLQTEKLFQARLKEIQDSGTTPDPWTDRLEPSPPINGKGPAAKGFKGPIKVNPFDRKAVNTWLDKKEPVPLDRCYVCDGSGWSSDDCGDFCTKCNASWERSIHDMKQKVTDLYKIPSHHIQPIDAPYPVEAISPVEEKWVEAGGYDTCRCEVCTYVFTHRSNLTDSCPRCGSANYGKMFAKKSKPPRRGYYDSLDLSIARLQSR